MTDIEKEIYVELFRTAYNNSITNKKYPHLIIEESLINLVSNMIASRSGEEAMYKTIDEVTKRGIIPMTCPYEGEFIGYKKCRDKSGSDVIVTLKIPAHAKRSSSLSKKCRCSKAIVVDIRMIMYDKSPIGNPLIKTNPRIDKTTSHNIDKAYSGRSGYPFNLGDQLVYRLGETVKPDSFDPNRFNECSHGIHFFMTEQEALDYCL